MALDGDKEPCRVRTSNAGQALFTGIADPDRAAMVARALTAPISFPAGASARCRVSEARYNPMSYHNGSIWPHDNALIAHGLRPLRAEAGAIDRMFQGMFDAASYLDFRRLPELFCGFRRSRRRGPTLYPVACSPQAWAAATPFCILQAALGLELDPVARQIRLRNPHLPPFLDEVTLRNVAIDDASADFAIRRRGSDVSVHVVRIEGNVEVSVVYSG